MKASIAIEPGSFFQETYTSHFEFLRVANKSISGFLKILHIFLKATSDNSYSVSSSNRLDSKSAIELSFDGIYEAYNQILRVSHHSQIFFDILLKISL